MSIQVMAKTLEEIPAEMRDFVTEKDGVFSYDSERAFKALKEEREAHRTAKAELSPFKALNMTAEEIQAIQAKVKGFTELGKSPAELAELIEKAGKPAPKPDVRKSTEYLELQKQMETLLDFKKNYEAEVAKNLENRRNEFVRKAIMSQLDKVNKEGLLSLFEEMNLFQKFALNDSKDGLAPINDKLPADYIQDFAERNHFIKLSTPGKAQPGNVGIKPTGGADYAAAKEKGDIQGMLSHCPTIE